MQGMKISTLHGFYFIPRERVRDFDFLDDDSTTWRDIKDIAIKMRPDYSSNEISKSFEYVFVEEKELESE